MICISLTHRTLLNAVQGCYRAIEASPQTEIMRNFLFSVHTDKLVISATNGEQELKCAINQSFDKEVQFTVPARTFYELCRVLPSDTIVEFLLDKDKLQVKSFKSQYNLMSLSADSYPVFEIGEHDASMVCDAKQLVQMMNRTFFAVAQQDMRYFLKGMLFDINNSELTLVGTDGHRMAVDACKLNAVSQENWQRKAIVPRKSVSEIKHMLEGAKEEVELLFSDQHVQIRQGDKTFSSVLIDAKYPDYERVIPSEAENPIIINRTEFIGGLSRVSAIFQDRHSGVELILSKGEMKLVGRNKGGEDVETQIDARYEGEDSKIGFNIQYLTDALNSLESVDVKLDLNQEQKASLLITPVAEEGEGEGEEGLVAPRHVIMPMLL
ncbi:MAG: DNA polymerase III subunit beta [Candidatus Eutrophobiaceae bacterium]